jgi:5'-nucleotidase
MNFSISLLKLNQYTLPFKQTQNNNAVFANHKNEFDTFEMSIGYVNDIHGQTNNMLRILSGIKGDLRLSAGDNDIGDEKNKLVHNVTSKFLNIAGIKATALGNHEFDTTQNDFLDTIKSFDGDVLTVNLKKKALELQNDFDVKTQGRADLDGYIKKSSIVNVKGERIGLVGASPLDMFERATHPVYHEDCSVSNLDETIESLQKEVNELKKQGVNKIILLSHLGYKKDRIVAEKTSDIDVIIGGHTHELIKDIKEGENLFYSKTGEPVILTEAGRDGRAFGLLNLAFDKNGVIKKAQNNLAETSNYYRNMINQYLFDEILGKPEKIGYIKKSTIPPATLIEENPHANFMCDAMRYELNADIAVWNNAGPRNFFHEGVINSRDIRDIAPFRDGVSVAEITEEKIVNWFKNAIETTYKSPGYKPGLVAVSGLNYTVDSKNGKLAGMNFVDKNGIEHKIDVNNPRKDKTYRLATDSFMMSAGADWGVLATKDEVEYHPECKDYYTCEYIKHLNKPIEINQTGRIKFI